MEIFFSDDIQGSVLRLPAEEAAHCVRVLRHRPGDRIEVIDGRGTLYHCTLLDSASAVTRKEGPVKNGQKRQTPPVSGVGGPSKSAKNDRAPLRNSDRGTSAAAVAQIDSVEPGWNSHPYRLTLAVCPTKNPDRYEWMAEKATEVGLDTLVPVIGDRSERKVLGKADRLGKILLSAAKQSLKGAVPTLAPAISVRDFIAGCSLSEAMRSSSAIPATLRLIAYCSDEVQPRASIMGLLRDFWKGWYQKTPKTLLTPGSEVGLVAKSAENATNLPEVVVLIGPEGDFSPEEVHAAMDAGFIPVTLGASRLRTETAAVTAAEAVYLSLL